MASNEAKVSADAHQLAAILYSEIESYTSRDGVKPYIDGMDENGNVLIDGEINLIEIADKVLCSLRVA